MPPAQTQPASGSPPLSARQRLVTQKLAKARTPVDRLRAGVDLVAAVAHERHPNQTEIDREVEELARHVLRVGKRLDDSTSGGAR